MIATDSFEILRVLVRNDVDFVIVGMTAAVLQGAPATTFDLDVVYALDETNVERLLAALAELDAVFRGDPAGRRLRPNASHLLSAGHKLLVTRFGLLDVLGSIEKDTRYGDLVPHAVTVDIEGTTVRVLGLARLITAKESAGRPKDLAVLPLLRATLAMTKKT